MGFIFFFHVDFNFEILKNKKKIFLRRKKRKMHFSNRKKQWLCSDHFISLITLIKYQDSEEYIQQAKKVHI